MNAYRPGAQIGSQTLYHQSLSLGNNLHTGYQHQRNHNQKQRKIIIPVKPANVLILRPPYMYLQLVSLPEYPESGLPYRQDKSHGCPWLWPSTPVRPPPQSCSLFIVNL